MLLFFLLLSSLFLLPLTAVGATTMRTIFMGILALRTVYTIRHTGSLLVHLADLSLGMAKFPPPGVLCQGYNAYGKVHVTPDYYTYKNRRNQLLILD